MEKHADVPEPLPVPSAFPPYPSSLLSQSSLPATVTEIYEAAGAADSLAALESLTGRPPLSSSSERDPRSAYPFPGGELAGRNRLQSFLYGSDVSSAADADGISTPAEDGDGKVERLDVRGGLGRDGNSAAAPIHGFKDSRMMASGVDNSAKLSAYMASGCLSSRMVHSEVRMAMQKHGRDTGHSCLIMHLTIRYACLIPYSFLSLAL